MHDPMVVVSTIRRPWPEKCGGRTQTRRWRYRWGSVFITLNHQEWYFPSLLTVWHVEPDGHDALSICQHKVTNPQNGEFIRYTHGWKWHVHHWHIQFDVVQKWRRRLFTRCEWCGGRSKKRDVVNHSCKNWIDWEPLHTNRFGETGLMHSDCLTAARVSRTCMCVDPTLSQGDYGQCDRCAGFRAWRQTPDDADRLLASLPKGTRIPKLMKTELERLWAIRRANV